MSEFISPTPVQHFEDNNGVPLSGGKLFTYASGTATKLATYIDASGATPNTNPIILNARGECNIWFPTGVAYTFVLSPATDTDPPTNAIWTVNDITASGTGGLVFSSSYATLAEADAAAVAAGGILLVNSNLALTSNLTLLSDAIIWAGGSITLSGFSVDVHGTISVPDGQLLFIGTGNVNAQGSVIAPIGSPAVLNIVSDLMNGEPVSLRSFVNTPDWPSIIAETSITDVTYAFTDAMSAFGQSTTPRQLDIPNGLYNISSSINARIADLKIRGRGFPTINMLTDNTPILLIGGNGQDIERIAGTWTNTQPFANTNAVMLRVAQSAWCNYSRLVADRGYGLMDLDSTVSNNYIFSSTIRSARCQYFSGVGLNVSGSSGNLYEDLYFENNLNGTTTGVGSCISAMTITGSTNDVFNRANAEWLSPTSSLILLNQAGSCVFNGTHFERLYPKWSFNGVIEMIGGGAGELCTPQFNGTSISFSDFSAQVNPGGFVVLDSSGVAASFSGLSSQNNVNFSTVNVVLGVGGAAGAYGSTVRMRDVVDLDGFFRTTGLPDVPRLVSLGTPPGLTPYPLQEFNSFKAGHRCYIAGNSGANISTPGQLTGTAPNGLSDPMGLWDATNKQFKTQVAGDYLASITIPTVGGTPPTIQIKDNGSVIAAVTLSAGVPFNFPIITGSGHNIAFNLTAGSYTDTNVTFGLALLGG